MYIVIDVESHSKKVVDTCRSTLIFRDPQTTRRSSSCSWWHRNFEEKREREKTAMWIWVFDNDNIIMKFTMWTITQHGYQDNLLVQPGHMVDLLTWPYWSFCIVKQAMKMTYKLAPLIYFHSFLKKSIYQHLPTLIIVLDAWLGNWPHFWKMLRMERCVIKKYEE